MSKDYIQIQGLNPMQVALLDEMWACDSYDEYQALLESLEPYEKLEALQLERLVLLAEMDRIVDEMPMIEAKEVLAKFML